MSFKINKIAYIIFFLDLIISSTIYNQINTSVSFILKVIRYLFYAYLTIKYVRDWLKTKRSIGIIQIIMCLIILIAYYYNRYSSLIILFLILCCVNENEIKDIIKINCYVYSICYILIVSLSLIGIIPDWIFYRGSIARHSLGFIYPTNAFGTFLSIVLMTFYSKGDNISFYELLIFEITNVFLYYLTDGRLSFFLITIILFVAFLMKLKGTSMSFKKILENKYVKIIIISFPFLAFFGILLLIYLYGKGNEFGLLMNNALSGRLSLSLDALSKYKLTMFGQQIKWYGWGGYGYSPFIDTTSFVYNYVDISYIRLLLDYGIVLTFIILLGFSLLILKSYKDKDYRLVLCVIFILIWSCVEEHLISIDKNIFLLFLLYFIQCEKLGCFKLENRALKYISKKTIKERKII